MTRDEAPAEQASLAGARPRGGTAHGTGIGEAANPGPVHGTRGGLAGSSPRVNTVLALGSNLGDRLANLQRGVDLLSGGAGLEDVAVSPVYETAPVGGPDQPDYLNAVLVATTSLSARAVLDRALAAEQALHRVRGTRWGPRTLDVDVIVYDDVVSADPELTLPHPRAHERAFVLAPWHDVDPGAMIPGKGPVADLLAAAGPAGIRLREDARIRIPS